MQPNAEKLNLFYPLSQLPVRPIQSSSFTQRTHEEGDRYGAALATQRQRQRPAQRFSLMRLHVSSSTTTLSFLSGWIIKLGSIIGAVPDLRKLRIQIVVRALKLKGGIQFDVCFVRRIEPTGMEILLSVKVFHCKNLQYWTRFLGTLTALQCTRIVFCLSKVVEQALKVTCVRFVMKTCSVLVTTKVSYRSV